MKKIFHLLFSAFLIYQSTNIVIGIGLGYAPDSFLMTVLVGWLLSLFVTGIFAFIGFALPSENLLPDKYYQIKNPGTLKKYYQLLGATYFQKALIKFHYGKPQVKLAFFNGKKSGIEKFITNTKKSEFGHLCPFVILLFITLYVFKHHFYSLGWSIMFFNILGNLYPVIIQRSHRLRLHRIQHLLDLKK